VRRSGPFPSSAHGSTEGPTPRRRRPPGCWRPSWPTRTAGSTKWAGRHPLPGHPGATPGGHAVAPQSPGWPCTGCCADAATCHPAAASDRALESGVCYRRGRGGPLRAAAEQQNPQVRPLHWPPRAISSGGERFLDTEEVRGSNPLSPTHSVAGASSAHLRVSPSTAGAGVEGVRAGGCRVGWRRRSRPQRDRRARLGAARQPAPSPEQATQGRLRSPFRRLLTHGRGSESSAHPGTEPRRARRRRALACLAVGAIRKLPGEKCATGLAASIAQTSSRALLHGHGTHTPLHEPRLGAKHLTLL
jgi:hypothetical protein